MLIIFRKIYAKVIAIFVTFQTIEERIFGELLLIVKKTRYHLAEVLFWIILINLIISFFRFHE